MTNFRHLQTLHKFLPGGVGVDVPSGVGVDVKGVGVEVAAKSSLNI